MSFIKADKGSNEWINLDHVVLVDVSGGSLTDVRVAYTENDGTALVYEKVAVGADTAEAIALARQVIQGASREIDLT